jgi:dihydropteroate synthase
MTKQSETNYTMQANVISALKQANKEKDQALDDFAESNMMLRKRIERLEQANARLREIITNENPCAL